MAIIGVTPAEFRDIHTGVEFDLVKLRAKFKTICPDYMSELKMDTSSQAVEFCSKVLFEIGPLARRVKASDGDKAWEFSFKKSLSEEATLSTGRVYIATFKVANNSFKQTESDKVLILTFKQSALLCMDTFCKLVTLFASLDAATHLMTPLCWACFSKTDLLIMSKITGWTVAILLVKMNSSAQSGGHYLPDSNGTLAAICVHAATRNLKQESVRQSICTKTINE